MYFLRATLILTQLFSWPVGVQNDIFLHYLAYILQLDIQILYSNEKWLNSILVILQAKATLVDFCTIELNRLSNSKEHHNERLNLLKKNFIGQLESKLKWYISHFFECNL